MEYYNENFGSASLSNLKFYDLLKQSPQEFHLNELENKLTNAIEDVEMAVEEIRYFGFADDSNKVALNVAVNLFRKIQFCLKYLQFIKSQTYLIKNVLAGKTEFSFDSVPGMLMDFNEGNMKNGN